MLQKVFDKICSDWKNTTTDDILHTVLLAVACLIIATFFGAFD